MASHEDAVGARELIPPFNLWRWIEENKHKLQPPVGAHLLFEESMFIIMAVGGPNRRSDYHINQTEEIFFQLKGDMVLKVNWHGEFKDIPIKEGDLFLLPANTPHSPQRFENTVGLVIEQKRREPHMDTLRWYCDSCKAIVFEETFHCEILNLGAALKPIIEKFYSRTDLRTCKKCGHVSEPPAKKE